MKCLARCAPQGMCSAFRISAYRRTFQRHDGYCRTTQEYPDATTQTSQTTTVLSSSTIFASSTLCPKERIEMWNLTVAHSEISGVKGVQQHCPGSLETLGRLDCSRKLSYRYRFDGPMTTRQSSASRHRYRYQSGF